MLINNLVSHLIEHTDFIIVGIVIHIFHVGGIALQNTETDVEVLCSKSRFFFDFLTGTTNTLFTYFANGFVAR